MEFDIDDVFETSSGLLWRVSAVVHADEVVYARDNDNEELDFLFSEVVKHWKAA